MKNSLRQNILNELKFLLNEDSEEASEATGSGFMSEDLIDIIQDINDAQEGQVAPGTNQKYVNLTNFGDDIDEGELATFITFAKKIDDESRVNASTGKAFEKLCRYKVVLINRVGPTDTYYYITCKKVGKILVPISAKKLADEDNEPEIPLVIASIEGKGGNIPASENDGSSKEKAMTFAEYQNYASNKENVKNKNVWYIDGTTKAYLIASHDANGNWVETKDENGKVIASAQGGGGSGGGGTGDGGLGKQLGASFKCTDDEAVRLWQGSLGVKADGNIGINTLTSAKKKSPSLFTANLKDYLEIGPDKKPTKDAQTRQLGLCNYLSKNKEEYRKNQKKISADGGRKSSATPKAPQTKQDIMATLGYSDNGWMKTHPGEDTKFVSAYNTNQAFRTAVDDAAKQGVLDTEWIYNNYKKYIRESSANPIKAESKNYYDNKKLNEAKTLFNKLLKKL